jgi:hypothetical protein
MVFKIVFTIVTALGYNAVFYTADGAFVLVKGSKRCKLYKSLVQSQNVGNFGPGSGQNVRRSAVAGMKHTKATPTRPMLLTILWEI